MTNLADMTKHIRTTLKRHGLKANVSKVSTGSMRNTIVVSRQPNKPFTVAEYREIATIMHNNELTGTKGRAINPNLFDDLGDDATLINQYNFKIKRTYRP